MEINRTSRPLKIAIVLDRFIPSKGGENYFSWLAEELFKRGHEVHIFAMAVDPSATTGYDVHRIPVWNTPVSLRILSFLIRSAHAMKPYEFDIIHGVGWSLAMNVFNPHGGVEQAYLRQEFRSISNRLYFLFKFVKRYLSPQHHIKIWIQRRQYLSQRVEKIIAISQMVKKDILRYYRIPEEKIVVVFNAIDLERFHPRNREVFREQKRADLGVARGTLLLIFVGNNYRLKGLEPLLRALVLLKKWYPDLPFQLLIIGRGQVGRYRRKARRLGISDLTLFLGPVKWIEQYYAASDIYVHPTFYDSCSLTVLEALASGLPVITSKFNGAAEAILSEAGGKVVEDPADVEGLAQAIATFFDEGRRKKAQWVAREWMERYPPQYNIEETLKVYDEVASKATG